MGHGASVGYFVYVWRRPKYVRTAIEEGMKLYWLARLVKFIFRSWLSSSYRLLCEISFRACHDFRSSKFRKLGIPSFRRPSVGAYTASPGIFLIVICELWALESVQILCETLARLMEWELLELGNDQSWLWNVRHRDFSTSGADFETSKYWHVFDVDWTVHACVTFPCGGGLEMRKTILTFFVTKLKQNVEAILKTYERFLMDTYIHFLIRCTNMCEK